MMSLILLSKELPAPACARRETFLGSRSYIEDEIEPPLTKVGQSSVSLAQFSEEVIVQRQKKNENKYLFLAEFLVRKAALELL
jgi:hypothetical protein